MAGLLSILGSTQSGLGAAMGSAATANNNLQNVNTPGYSRQQANVTEGVSTRIGGALLGGGSVLSGISQARDRFIEAQLPSLMGQASYSSAQAEALEGMSAFDGGGTNALPQSLSAFYSSLSALSANPGDTSLRSAALGAATTLARAFNTTSANIEGARTGLDRQITGSLDQINQLASQVASLNQKIMVARGSGAEPNDLLDARQRAQDQLSQLTGTKPIADAQGNVSLMLPGGGALVSGSEAGKLVAVADATNGGHPAIQLQSPGSIKASPLPNSALGGSVGGWLNARDGSLADAASGLDTLAASLGTAMNDLHRAGVGTDGSTNLDLFTFGATAGAAGRIAVNATLVGHPEKLAAASATNASGDGSNLAKLIATQNEPIDSLATLVTSYGAASKSARASSDHDGSLRDSMTAARDSASGVSVDQEVVELTKAQRAYEAVSQVIQTTNSMLDALFKIA
jgi:flagellar hook-associated protein 1 FlgK